MKFVILLLIKCLNPCYSGRWSRRICQSDTPFYQEVVLILVIAVDGLGDSLCVPRSSPSPVLILVIAVDGLGAMTACAIIVGLIIVLILVIAVDGLGVRQNNLIKH